MSEDSMNSVRPILIKVHTGDNVAVVGNEGGLPAGTRAGGKLVLREHVPEGHKVALAALSKGEAIRRYGHTIGFAAKDIPEGSWIEESLVLMPKAPELSAVDIPAATSDRPEPISGRNFDAFRNADGTVGSRNILAISTSVQCTVGVLQNVVARIKSELLPKFPNVDDVVAIRHIYGCGVAIEAPNAEIPIRTIENISRHPNFGGETIFVGLGCEKLAISRILGSSLAEPFILQEQGGYEAMVRRLTEEAAVRLARLNARRREQVPLSELVVGVQCGGSDALSGVTANPALGYAADLIVRAGGTVLFSEVTEVRDAIDVLVARASDSGVAKALLREMDWYDRYLERGGVDRSANTTPGNKKGGLANIVEKALGSIVKSGSTPICDVLGPGERVRKKGLVFAATPASDFICGTSQLASGIHLQVFTTGRGTPYGLEAVPVIKVGTRTSLYRQWPDLIDVDAGRIASGKASIEEVGTEIFEMIIDAASGRIQPWAEHWGIHNDLAVFNPAPVT